MTIKTPASLKSFFEAGDRPSQVQFVDLIDSTYSGEIGAAIVSGAAVSAGVLRIDSASAVSILDSGSAGEAVLAAGTLASARTVLEAGSAGQAVWLSDTAASAQTAIDVTAATMTKAGLIEIATTAETRAGVEASKAAVPSTLPIVQVQNTQTGAVATGTTAIPADDTIPQITEGDEYMTLAITPTNASNILAIEVVFYSSHSSQVEITAALFQDATANALAAGMQIPPSTTNKINGIVFRHSMTAGTTSSTTFRVRAGGNTGATLTFNGAASSRLLGGIMASSITITEIRA